MGLYFTECFLKIRVSFDLLLIVHVHKTLDIIQYLGLLSRLLFHLAQVAKHLRQLLLLLFLEILLAQHRVSTFDIFLHEALPILVVIDQRVDIRLQLPGSAHPLSVAKIREQ